MKPSGVGPRGCSRPTVRAGIVSASGEQDDMGIKPAPHDHFAPGPDRGVIYSALGRVGGAGGRPTIGSRIISPASVHRRIAAIAATPDDHFAPGPDRGVIYSALGRVGRAGVCPGVIDASGPFRYIGKRIVSTRRCR